MLHTKHTLSLTRERHSLVDNTTHAACTKSKRSAIFLQALDRSESSRLIHHPAPAKGLSFGAVHPLQPPHLRAPTLRIRFLSIIAQSPASPYTTALHISSITAAAKQLRSAPPSRNDGLIHLQVVRFIPQTLLFTSAQGCELGQASARVTAGRQVGSGGALLGRAVLRYRSPCAQIFARTANRPRELTADCYCYIGIIPPKKST